MNGEGLGRVTYEHGQSVHLVLHIGELFLQHKYVTLTTVTETQTDRDTDTDIEW